MRKCVPALILALVMVLSLTLGALANGAVTAPMAFGDPNVALTGAGRPAVVDNGTGFGVWYMKSSTMYYSTADANGVIDGAGAVPVTLTGGANWASNATSGLGDCPFVMKANDGKFYMWVPDYAGTAIKLYVASAAAGPWTFVRDVFTKGSTDTAWDYGKIDEPMVIFDGTQYRLFYQGSNLGLSTAYSIGLANGSTPTIDTVYTANSVNPVLSPTPGTFYDYRVFQPYVVKTGGQYYMWFGGNNVGYAGGPNAIGFATSTDLVNWSPAAAPIAGVLDPVVEAAPSVVPVGGTWHIWYMKGADIAHATASTLTGITTGSFTVVFSSGGVPVYGTILGVEVQPDIDFGNIMLGAADTTAPLTVRNTGNVTEGFTFSVDNANAGGAVVLVSDLAGVAAGTTGTATVHIDTRAATMGQHTVVITVTAHAE